jgi:hypothetical protein
VRLAGRLGGIRNPDAFGAYLRKTVVNLSRSHFRHKRVERAYLEREGRSIPREQVEGRDLGEADALVGGAVALRTVVSTDAAPVPPAEREGRDTPPPPESLEGEIVASGYHDGAWWWLTAEIDRRGDLCMGFTLEDGTGGGGCSSASPGGESGDPIGLHTFSQSDLGPTIYYGEVRRDIVALEFKGDGGSDRIETTPAPTGSEFDLRFYTFFGDPVDKIVGYNAAGEAVAEVSGVPDVGGLGMGPDLEEVVASGSHAGSRWTLTASPISEGPCYTFEIEDGGGGGCATEPGTAWRGDVNQSATPRHPEVRPVWGAIPLRIDDVRIGLQDGKEIPAVIFRPEGHDYAYYIAWIPDAFAPGEVMFRTDSEVTTEPLCASSIPNRGGAEKYRHGVTCGSSAAHP